MKKTKLMIMKTLILKKKDHQGRRMLKLELKDNKPLSKLFRSWIRLVGLRVKAK